MTKYNMNCKCLEQIKNRLTKHHGKTSQISLELIHTINMKTFKERMAVPPLFYTYMDGKKKLRSYVKFNYCPFCGKKNI